MGKREKELGMLGEQIAREYLERWGYWVREQNYRCKRGEIDIIAQNEGGLYFVEVKTRSRRGSGYGRPAEAVTYDKIQRIYMAVRHYIKANECEGEEIHIDVIEVRNEDGRFYVDHIKDIGGG